MAEQVDDNVEAIFNRLNDRDGVVGVLCTNAKGLTVKTSLGEKETKVYAALLHTLVQDSSEKITSLDATNDLSFIHLKTRKNEIHVCTEAGSSFLVLQSLSDKAV
eukprot:TRINITY_DN15115_c0_g1_i1.p3 TRINITY_DN15115_c0_g1~~TRINITY_DN15115_c0_g1_i1.p3  ORF type:complete len:105 (+),score=30.79 TRINITY_DN15115_c0_g1_i1:15-329(+)